MNTISIYELKKISSPIIIDIRDNYANFILLYQDQEIADVEISKFAESSWIDRDTTADKFVQVYLGQHAELKSSSELQLDR